MTRVYIVMRHYDCADDIMGVYDNHTAASARALQCARDAYHDRHDCTAPPGHWDLGDINDEMEQIDRETFRVEEFEVQRHPPAEFDKQRITALRESVEKWDKIVSGTGADWGMRNCSLCHTYRAVSDEDGEHCAGCPVREATGETYCRNTPYEVYARMPDEHFKFVNGEGWYAVTDRAKEVAKMEADFLRSLLEGEV